MKKKIISLILAGLMIFPLVGCNNDELQSKIDELQAKIAQQEQTIAGLQTQNEELSSELDNLQTKNEELQNKVEEMEKTGTFYTLKEAYEKGYLTQTDVKHISYYMVSSVTMKDEDGNWVQVSFAPTSPLKRLTDDVESYIVWSYYQNYKDTLECSLGDLYVAKCLGEYNGYYVVSIDGDSTHGTGGFQEEVANIKWYQLIASLMVFVP